MPNTVPQPFLVTPGQATSMANVVQAEPEPQIVEDTLASDEQGIGTLGIILIVILLLLLFGVIGFSFNS